jgi:hypothetical protein
LLEAAKADGPSSSARAKVWSTLSSTLGAGAAGAAASASLGGIGAAKTLMLGTLLGGTVTVGLAVSALTLGPLPSFGSFGPRAGHDIRPGTTPAIVESPEPAVVRSVILSRAVDPGEEEPSETRALHPRSTWTSGTPHAHGANAEGVRAQPGAAAPSRHASAVPPPPEPASAGDTNDLAREASLLGSARAALVRGDADAALRAVHATLGVRNRQLVPEELALEAQALRALGRGDEAAAVESRLRARFPESALAR